MSPVQRLRQRIEHDHWRDTRPCFLVVDFDLRVREITGDAAHYGLGDLAPGTDAADALLFLQGSDDAVDAHRTLEFLQTASGRYARVQILRLDDGWGLAYQDASHEHERRQRSQQASNELALLKHHQERLLRELEQANRLKGLFIAHMSHEFRTPLGSILGYTELLMEDLANNPQALDMLGAVRRGATHLLDLVENLLTQARLEQDELPLRPTAVDLVALAAQLDELFRPLARQKRLGLSWRHARNLPKAVWLDALRLRQILVNLLGNAVKFTHAGDVSVAIDWSDDTLCLAVADTGPGIAAELTGQLFEPFRQGRGGQGSGLGLAISRALARRMGGDLELSSTPGQGTTVHLRVPARAAGRMPRTP